MRTKKETEYITREILEASNKLTQAKLNSNVPAIKLYKYWLDFLVEEDLNERKNNK